MNSAGGVWNGVLDICFAMHGQCGSLRHDTRRRRDRLQDIQGIVVGALINMPVSDRLGLGNVSF